MLYLEIKELVFLALLSVFYILQIFQKKIKNKLFLLNLIKKKRLINYPKLYFYFFSKFISTNYYILSLIIY